jgi:NADPH:quinone reductase-like Zn-dependent oxidoreductase
MYNTISTFAAKLRRKYQQWRGPDHSVDAVTEALYEEALADLRKNGKVCLDDLQFTETRKERARTTFNELASKGYLEPVEGERDTWETGELYELLHQA